MNLLLSFILQFVKLSFKFLEKSFQFVFYFDLF